MCLVDRGFKKWSMYSAILYDSLLQSDTIGHSSICFGFVQKVGCMWKCCSGVAFNLYLALGVVRDSVEIGVPNDENVLVSLQAPVYVLFVRVDVSVNLVSFSWAVLLDCC